MHENFQRDEEVKAGNERTFGLVFSGFFLLVGLAPLLHKSQGAARIWALILSAVFLIASFFWTPALRPLNRAWTKLGVLLHAVVSPLVMALLFYGVVTPFGMVMRALSKDPLRLQWESKSDSYWIIRDLSELSPETMKNQF
jgi:hypothetical protein